MHRNKLLEHFDTWKVFSMISLWQNFFIKVVFEHILVRSDYPKICSFSPPHLEKFSLSITPSENFIFSCSNCSCTIFVLTSYSSYTQVMLILLIFNIYRMFFFNFKKSRNGQIHSSSDSQHPIKKFQQNLPFLPLGDLSRLLTLLENPSCCIKIIF